MHQVFDTLQFRVLRDRLYEYLEAVEPEAESGFDLAGEVLGPGRCGPGSTAHAPAGAPVGVAVAGTFGRGTGALTGLAVADRGRARRPGSTRPRWTPTTRPRWPPGWPTRARPKVIHDAKPALLAFAAHGWELDGLDTDTALAAYLARPDQRTYDLADLALRYLQRELRDRGRRGGAASSPWTASATTGGDTWSSRT